MYAVCQIYSGRPFFKDPHKLTLDDDDDDEVGMRENYRGECCKGEIEKKLAVVVDGIFVLFTFLSLVSVFKIGKRKTMICSLVATGVVLTDLMVKYHLPWLIIDKFSKDENQEEPSDTFLA